MEVWRRDYVFMAGSRGKGAREWELQVYRPTQTPACIRTFYCGGQIMFSHTRMATSLTAAVLAAAVAAGAWGQAGGSSGSSGGSSGSSGAIGGSGSSGGATDS